jgi:hypothetical protein
VEVVRRRLAQQIQALTPEVVVWEQYQQSMALPFIGLLVAVVVRRKQVLVEMVVLVAEVVALIMAREPPELEEVLL